MAGLVPHASIAKKVVMAISGVLIIGFLLAHLTGNLLLYVGADAFNLYAHKLTENRILLYPAELILVCIFLAHIVMGVRVTLENRAARRQGYDQKKRLGKGTLMSKTMAVSGTVILVFLILHLVTFKYGASGTHTLANGGGEVRDLYGTVLLAFSNPLYSLFYIIAMCCMGLHIAHAGQSALRTLGLSHERYTQLAVKASWALAIFFTIGFCSFPVTFGFCKCSSSSAPTCEVPATEVIP